MDIGSKPSSLWPSLGLRTICVPPGTGMCPASKIVEASNVDIDIDIVEAGEVGALSIGVSVARGGS